MSCASIDLKAYLLGETSKEERLAVEQHLPVCEACREEVERLGIMQTALMSLRDEEIPRRIAFVSDKVFEPRWYQKLWNSGPAAGFASAMVLAGAILAHGFMQPAVVTGPAVAAISQSEIDARVQLELDRRLDEVVAKAVTAATAQQERVFTTRVTTVEHRLGDEMAANRAAFIQSYDVLNKRFNRMIKDTQYADASLGGRQ